MFNRIRRYLGGSYTVGNRVQFSLVSGIFIDGVVLSDDGSWTILFSEFSNEKIFIRNRDISSFKLKREK